MQDDFKWTEVRIGLGKTTFNFYVSEMENTLNGEKNYYNWALLVNKTWEKLLDPLFQSMMVFIKPKNHLTLLSL